MSPLNESHLVQRERWPLSFDLEGMPNDTAVRGDRLQFQLSREKEMQTRLVQNTFATNYQQAPVIDINNPPSPYPGGRYKFVEFPKSLYPAGYPKDRKVITVNSPEEEAKMLKKGYLLQPPAAEPTAEDLDAVAEEEQIAAKTSGKRTKA